MLVLSQHFSLPLLAAAGCALYAAAPMARADALSEVRIVQVQLGPDGSFIEVGAPLSVRSFADGGRQFGTGSLPVTISVGPGAIQSWDFAYEVTMRVEGPRFPGFSPPPVCWPAACVLSPDGMTYASAFFEIGSIDGKITPLPSFAQFSGTYSFGKALRDNDSFEQSGLVHLEAGSSSALLPWSGVFYVGATTVVAAIPEPGTYAQMVAGLGLLAGAFAHRGRLQRREKQQASKWRTSEAR